VGLNPSVDLLACVKCGCNSAARCYIFDRAVHRYMPTIRLYCDFAIALLHVVCIEPNCYKIIPIPYMHIPYSSGDGVTTLHPIVYWYCETIVDE
jgi:hypothetical protein